MSTARRLTPVTLAAGIVGAGAIGVSAAALPGVSGAAWVGIPSTAAAADQSSQSAGYGAQHKPPRPRETVPLVDKVRRATGRYKHINVALAEGWVRGTPCVSGPNSGAMGVHFVLPARIDGVVNAEEPESLIYEPMPGGAYRLVGVEFIVLAAAWASQNPAGGTPSVDGHLTNYVGEPNRYGLPAFYELHVWAWEQNPNGNFADWNTEVSCDKQAAE
jgi:hypothetical protein